MIPNRVVFAIVFAGVLGALPVGAQAPAAEQLLVSPQWLSRHLHDPDLVILQNDAPEGYAKEHIPGSRYVKWGDLDTPVSGAEMKMDELPALADLRRKLEQLGVSDRSDVVVAIGGNDVPYATRLLFLLSYVGLHRIALLDGGVKGWKAAGEPVTNVVPVVTPGHLTVAANPTLGVDYKYVQAIHRGSTVKLIDARDTRYYNGPKQTEMGGGMLSGHIPGAASMPYKSLYDESLRILPKAQLQALFRAAGVQPGDTVVAYCHVGIQATVVLLAARLLGNPIHLYVGSFHDWSDHNLPTEGGTP